MLTLTVTDPVLSGLSALVSLSCLVPVNGVPCWAVYAVRTI